MKINEIITEVLNKDTGTPNPDPAPKPSLANRALGRLGKSAALGLHGIKGAANIGLKAFTGRRPTDPWKKDYGTAEVHPAAMAQEMPYQQPPANQPQQNMLPQQQGIPIDPNTKLVIRKTMAGVARPVQFYKTVTGWYNELNQKITNPASIESLEKDADTQIDNGTAKILKIQPTPQPQPTAQNRQVNQPAKRSQKRQTFVQKKGRSK